MKPSLDIGAAKRNVRQIAAMSQTKSPIYLYLSLRMAKCDRVNKLIKRM